jgi:hypothetical protein
LEVVRDTRSAEAAEAQLERFIAQRHEKRVQSEELESVLTLS